MELDEQLRAALAASEESYREIAEKTGIDHSSLARFATGKRTLRLDMAAKLAAYLGLSLQPDTPAPAGKPAAPPKRAVRKKKSP